MQTESKTTRILFVEDDECSFQVRQCVARVLSSLPPVELFHARDATEALAMLEDLRPDVIVLDDEAHSECSLLIDSLTNNHPPIVLRTDADMAQGGRGRREGAITYIPKNESLEGIHQTLMLVAAIGVKGTTIVTGSMH